MKSERSQVDIIYGLVLFTVVCLSLLLHMERTFHASDNPELGLLLFLLSGAAVSYLSLGQRVLHPLLGTMLTAPVCMVTMRLLFVTHRTFQQETAWIPNAVFWYALGVLCFLFICT